MGFFFILGISGFRGFVQDFAFGRMNVGKSLEQSPDYPKPRRRNASERLE